MNFDFGELKNDTSFVSKVQASSEAISNIQKMIDEALLMKTEDMTVEERVKFDLFLVYAVNSLYFMYLKANGDDVSKHGIKHEMNRIKEAMQRNQQIKDKSLRPQINQDVAKRFVKSGLYDMKKKNQEFRRRYEDKQKQSHMRIDINYNPDRAPNRKRKFEDTD
jgi:exosome complex protein LRP1